MRMVIFIGLALTIAATSTFAEWKDTEISRLIPLPQKIQIVPPAPELPKELAAFSGRWEGVWENGAGVEAILIVCEINPKKAKIIYGWNYIAGGSRRGYDSYTAKVRSGPKPKLEFGSAYATFVFEMQDDLKTIRGIREGRNRNINAVTMKKIED